MVEGLRNLVRNVRDAASQVASASSQVAGASDDSAKVSLQTASAIDEVTSTMHEMSVNVQNMVKNTRPRPHALSEHLPVRWKRSARFTRRGLVWVFFTMFCTLTLISCMVLVTSSMAEAVCRLTLAESSEAPATWLEALATWKRRRVRCAPGFSDLPPCVQKRYPGCHPWSEV